MTVLIHVMGALSGRGAGVSRAVWEMASAQARVAGDKWRVQIAGNADSEWAGLPPAQTAEGLQVLPFDTFGPSMPGWAPQLAKILKRNRGQTQIVHSHGMWRYHNWGSAAHARKIGAPLVVSPHGMLCPWSFRHARWKKLPAFHLCERKNLAGAACILASSPREARDIAAFEFGSAIATIPFGVSLSEFPEPALPSAAMDTAWRDFLGQHPRLKDKRIILFLGRIHPVKAPEHLIEAFAHTLASKSDFELVMAGPYEQGMRDLLDTQARGLGFSGQLTFSGAVSGDMKRALLQRSDLLVLCSHNENFGYVVPEALASGTPVIVSDETPWEQVGSVGCGWSYKHGAPGLSAALAGAAQEPIQELKKMGARGRRWIENEFAWPEIARKLFEMYQWTLDGGKTPSFVKMPA